MEVESGINHGLNENWRDLGYAFGAVITGVLADLLGLQIPTYVIGLLTIVSAMVIMNRMRSYSIRFEGKKLVLDKN